MGCGDYDDGADGRCGGDDNGIWIVVSLHICEKHVTCTLTEYWNCLDKHA